MNIIRIENLDEIEIEWSNIPSNTDDDDTFKCARILLNDETEFSSSYLIRINDLVSVRYDIDLRVLRKLAVRINDDKNRN